MQYQNTFTPEQTGKYSTIQVSKTGLFLSYKIPDTLTL